MGGLHLARSGGSRNDSGNRSQAGRKEILTGQLNFKARSQERVFLF
jgi:hypothetical protein